MCFLSEMAEKKKDFSGWEITWPCEGGSAMKLQLVEKVGVPGRGN